MEQLNSSKYSSENAGRSGGGANNMAYLVAGGLLGAAAALLLAPKSGPELRSDVAGVARRGYDGALDLTSSVKEQAGTLYQTAREKGTGAALSDAVAAGKQLLSGTASDAAEKAGDVLSLADDKEGSPATNFTSSEH